MSTKSTTKDKPDSLFERLAKIDCSAHVEKKGKFNYLSWVWAWDMLKKECPDATFKKHIFQKGDESLPYMKDAAGNAWVVVSVTVEDQTNTEVFPLINGNQTIKNPNAFQINTAHMRALTKAIAFFGLGLYIYAGEDVPEEVANENTQKNKLNGAKEYLAKITGDIAAQNDRDALIAYKKKQESMLITSERMDFINEVEELSDMWSEIEDAYQAKLEELTEKEKKVA